MTGLFSESVIESGIHRRCAASAELAVLLDTDRIFTGTPIHRSPPYICVQRKNARPLFVTNLGTSAEEAYLVLEVRHSCYETTSQIVSVIRDLFDAAVWETGENTGLILRSEIAENDTIQRDDATWEWGMTMRVRLLRTADFTQ
ncbi:MAG: hypothetical protein Q4C47_00735 [Planctomycetia bacterium]|nr:hypothetical protein [Planctomycetia bacterium]